MVVKTALLSYMTVMEWGGHFWYKAFSLHALGYNSSSVLASLGLPPGELGSNPFQGLLTLLLGSLLGRFLLISFLESALATVKHLGRVGHSPTPTFSSLTQAPVLSGPLGMPTFLR